MKEINLLSKGLFNSKLLDSRVKTRAVSKKEKIWGHLIGPLGMIFVVNTVAALVEKFFMQMVGNTYPTVDGDPNPMSVKLGEQYELALMVIKFIAVGIGLVNSWLVSHTKSKQGRFRPWYLIFSLIGIAVGALIFLFSPNVFGEVYWTYFFILLACYHTVGSSFFYVFRDNIVSVTTRDSVEKQQVSFMRKLCWTLISGILIGMLVNSVLVPFWLQNDISGYPILMIALSVCAIPLLFMEYFYTKERVIDDANLESASHNANKIPLKAQLKALLTNRNYLIMFFLTSIIYLSDNFKGGNVQYYYIQYMLGGVDNPSMQMIYQIVTGVPLGIGAFIIYPISRKIGVKNLTWGGYALVLLGSVLGLIFPSNVPVALVAGFMRNLGLLPNAYIMIMLLYYAFDDVEFRTGLRLEGLLGVGIFTAVQYLAAAPLAGGYESQLLKMGFIDNLEVMPDPSPEIKQFMSLCFYLIDIVIATAFVVLLPFMNAEKHIPTIKKELLKRKKEAVIASGQTWLEPEEQDVVDRAKAAAEAEENRIADLKELCEKKGLNFDEENAKYLQAKEKADAAWEKKQAEKEEKRKLREQKREERRKQKEARRLQKLQDRCAKEGLDFDEENKKYFDEIEEKKLANVAVEAAWQGAQLEKYDAFRSWMEKDEAARAQKRAEREEKRKEKKGEDKPEGKD